jgi:uncharacterized protein YndB with AHSA1/START domain
MTVTNVQKDLDALTLTITTEFEATPERVWQLWADPRQLERWWGPPTYPATMDSHDLRAGGRVEYHMTGPTGDQPRGLWDVLEVEPPRTLVFRDLFADEKFNPNLELPAMTGTVTIEPLDAGRTQMTIKNQFESRDGMDKVLAMGMEEGMTLALAQIDAILNESTAQVGAAQ